MRKALIVLAVVMLSVTVFFTGYSTGSRMLHTGYTVYYNAESGKGIVYVSKSDTSSLIVGYPSTNLAFMYNRNGQRAINHKELENIMTNPEAGVLASTVGVIVPID